MRRTVCSLRVLAHSRAAGSWFSSRWSAPGKDTGLWSRDLGSVLLFMQHLVS